MADRALVLVTGGTGFVGRRLVEELVARGHNVRALGRRYIARWRNNPKIEMFRADISAPDTLQRALHGVRCVYHLAAATSGNWDASYRVTVEGTRRLLDLLTERPGTRLLVVSSLSVYAGGHMNDGTVVTESFPLEDSVSRGPYARAKTEADRLAQQYLAHPSVKLTIVRPGLIYGLGMRNPLSGAALSIVPWIWLVLGRGDKPLPLVHLDDVVRILVEIAHDHRSIGKIYNIVPASMPTQNCYFTSYRKAFRKRPVLVRLPATGLLSLVAASDAIIGVLTQRNPGRLATLRRSLRHVRYDAARLLRDLDLTPRIDLDQGMALAARTNCSSPLNGQPQ